MRLRTITCSPVLAFALVWPALGAAQDRTASRRTPPADAVTAVRAAAAGFTAAMDAKDGRRIGESFAEGAVGIYPSGDPTIGREANRRRWMDFFTLRNPEHPATTDTVVVAAGGDMAYTIGRWAAAFDADTGRVRMGGRYMAVWRPVGGTWQIASLAANSLQPPPALDRPSR